MSVRHPISIPIPFPEIQTDRLRLRALRSEDRNDYLALYSSSQVAAGHGMAPWHDLAQAENLIAFYAGAAGQNKACRWAITLLDRDRLIGSVGFHSLDSSHFRGEIGYDLLPDYWRQGIASEAVRAAVRFGFERIGFHRIEAIVDPGNLASATLLRKVGFTEEGYLRQRFFDSSRFVDDWMFSILEDEMNGS